MARPKSRKPTVRFSIGLDERAHHELSIIASETDTTIAWVVRRAVSEFIDRQAPRAQSELPLMRRSGTAASA